MLVPALACAVIALGGCGASDSDQVRSKMQQFLHATAGRDYRTLCRQVLAPSLLSRFTAVNVPCEDAMRIALEGVQNPVLSIDKITVKGSSASAITLSGAHGESGSLDTVELVKTGRGWRVASLGSPAASSAAASPR
jgi:hypothetical protein